MRSFIFSFSYKRSQIKKHYSCPSVASFHGREGTEHLCLWHPPHQSGYQSPTAPASSRLSPPPALWAAQAAPDEALPGLTEPSLLQADLGSPWIGNSPAEMTKTAAASQQA